MTMTTATYTPTTEALLSRAAKLQALSDRAGTPEEAATAAAKLQDMLIRHNLTLQQVEQETRTKPAYEVKDHRLQENRVNRAWERSLHHGVAKANQCESIYWKLTDPPHMRIVGRAHNIEMTHTMFVYLREQIKLLARTAAEYSENPTAYRRAFCLGAVDTIRDRLRETTNTIQRETAQNNALMIVEQQLVKSAVRDILGPTRRSTTRSSYSSGSGFSAGRQAGHHIGLRRPIPGAGNALQIQ